MGTHIHHMESLNKIENFEINNTQIRYKNDNNENWFCVTDIAKCLNMNRKTLLNYRKANPAHRVQIKLPGSSYSVFFKEELALYMISKLQKNDKITQQLKDSLDQMIRKLTKKEFLKIYSSVISNEPGAQYIYIVTNNFQEKESIFKFGGVSRHDLLERRLKCYNCGIGKDFRFYFVKILEVDNFRTVENKLHSVIPDKCRQGGSRCETIKMPLKSIIDKIQEIILTGHATPFSTDEYEQKNAEKYDASLDVTITEWFSKFSSSAPLIKRN